MDSCLLSDVYTPPKLVVSQDGTPDLKVVPKRGISKSVRFCEDVLCHLVVPPLQELSKEDVHMIWYSNQEYTIIKDEIRNTLKLMTRKVPVVENGHVCYRGLEFRTKDGVRLKRMRRERAYDVVFGEQDRHNEEGRFNARLLSRKYEDVSDESRNEAFERAKDDAKYVVQLNEKRQFFKRKFVLGLGRYDADRAVKASS